MAQFLTVKQVAGQLGVLAVAAAGVFSEHAHVNGFGVVLVAKLDQLAVAPAQGVGFMAPPVFLDTD